MVIAQGLEAGGHRGNFLSDNLAAQVGETIRGHAGELLRRLEVFDLYRGAPLAASEKSLAFRLVFGSRDRTLTEAEVDDAVSKVQQGLAADLGAHLRA